MGQRHLFGGLSFGVGGSARTSGMPLPSMGDGTINVRLVFDGVPSPDTTEFVTFFEWIVFVPKQAFDFKIRTSEIESK